MRLASFILSLCLHAGVFLFIWYWPGSGPVAPTPPPMLISLVDGAMGGNKTPSPILGHMGEPADGELAPSAPAPQSEIAAPAREESKPVKPEAAREAEAPETTLAPPQPAKEPEKAPEPAEVPAAKEPEPKPEPPKPAPKPELPKPEAKPEPKKPELPKPEAKKEPPKKPAPKPAPKKQNVDPVAAALQKARKATSRASSGDRGNAVEQALAQAKKSAGGTRGGGGGEGSGPGGGGLGDVYQGRVMLAVRPNWGFASPGRKGLVCVVKVKVDLNGKVEQATISKSSGNPQYDASAVNAIIRTSNSGDFPPPPNINYTELDLVFTLSELMGR